MWLLNVRGLRALEREELGMPTPSTKVELWKVEVSSPASLHLHLHFTEEETDAQKGGKTHNW